MCGIFGFTGRENAVDYVFRGLSALEYRGYDSAGMGYFENNELHSIKESGKLYRLKEKISMQGIPDTCCAIGHTRWATHGEPSDENAHPHGTENVLIVHNGIIENSDSIKRLLTDNGYRFKSATDTEAAAKLIDFCYAASGEPTKAIWQAIDLMEGSYGIAAIFKDFPNEIYAFCKDNPLVAAKGEMGFFVASDPTAIADYSEEYFSIDEREIALVSGNSIRFVTPEGKDISKELCVLKSEENKSNDEKYEHFMLKEICEEPDAVQKTIEAAVKGGNIYFENCDDLFASIKNIHIAACGTAYHAGLVGKRIIETLAGIPVRVYYASEFRYSEPILDANDLVIAVSQSGETADTIGALRLAKKKCVHTFAVVNAANSTIAREAERVFVTRAGKEVAVASTKAYHVQLTAFYLLALKLAALRNNLPSEEIGELLHVLINDVPHKIREAIERREQYERIAKKYMNSDNMFFIGRGVDVAQSKEAALKMKEISYIHCHAFAAGELKHGTIALVEQGTPVVAIITDRVTLGKMISNIHEVRARGASVVLLVSEQTAVPTGVANDIIYLPDTLEIFMPLVCASATQLMAYYTSVNLGNDVDKPRNLAKSVTVE